MLFQQRGGSLVHYAAARTGPSVRDGHAMVHAKARVALSE